MNNKENHNEEKNVIQYDNLKKYGLNIIRLKKERL